MYQLFSNDCIVHPIDRLLLLLLLLLLHGGDGTREFDRCWGTTRKRGLRFILPFFRYFLDDIWTNSSVLDLFLWLPLPRLNHLWLLFCNLLPTSLEFLSSLFWLNTRSVEIQLTNLEVKDCSVNFFQNSWKCQFVTPNVQRALHNISIPTNATVAKNCRKILFERNYLHWVGVCMISHAHSQAGQQGWWFG